MSESAAPVVKSMDEIVALCKRRGFIFQSSEIYGGINGFWDYGPLGVLLKKNLKDAWWQDIVQREMDGPDGKPVEIVGLDSAIIMNPKVWEASGHVAGFNDPMVDDRESKQRFRGDHLFGMFMVEVDPAAEPWEAETLKLRERVSTDFSLAPSVTVTASSEEEARSIFILNCKELLRDAKFAGFTLAEPRPRADLVLGDQSGRTYIAEIKHLGIKRLETIASEIPSPIKQRKGVLTEPRQFNLMLPTHVGAVFDEESKAYLRPETAQGIFVNFWNVTDTSRVKVPFGIAQVGKAFRNEVTPRNFTFRSREFEQMEIEFFIHPESAAEWYAYWRDSRYRWWQSIGLAGENLQLREHERDELAHYAKEGAGTSDIEYRFPFTAPGFGELEGVAHRADFDLKAHAHACGKGEKMRYFDQERNEFYFPHVIEPSAGADRGTLAVLCEAFTPTPERSGSKYVMNFHPRLAPIKAAVFPLVNKDGMPEVGDRLYRKLRSRWMCQYDAKQSIGKRYARMDEAGTPYCFTIDSETLSDQTVTVRHRDTAQQERISLESVETFLAERIGT